ncbi:MAG TPA: hypothetical protein PKE29_13390 [Phycisphaerales bacterium]|nr:hypothetical protein [Phycisphaerales bacterium]
MSTISLIELARSVGTATVDVGGRQVIVSAVGGWEQNLIEAAMPRPEAPQILDPSKGSLSTDTIPNESDPGFLDDLERWFYRFRVLIVAAATDHTPENGRAWSEVRGTKLVSGSRADVLAWCQAAMVDLADLSTPAVAALYRGVILAGMPARPEALEAAEKK